jgi:hypothetical protein
MIERYFETGVRLTWTFPGDHQEANPDGRIIDNPSRPAGAMVASGKDAKPTGKLARAWDWAWSTSLSYSWLAYSPGYTTRIRLQDSDVLTGYMSGCLITQCTEGGVRYVGHIGTDDFKPEVSRLVKERFTEFLPADAIGFNPFAAWSDDAIRNSRAEVAEALQVTKLPAESKILGLVTTRGGCYAVLLLKMMDEVGVRNSWRVGGCTGVEPMETGALRVKLTT